MEWGQPLLSGPGLSGRGGSGLTRGRDGAVPTVPLSAGWGSTSRPLLASNPHCAMLRGEQVELRGDWVMRSLPL